MRGALTKLRIALVRVAVTILAFLALELPASAQTAPLVPPAAFQDRADAAQAARLAAFSCNAVTEIPKTECAALVDLYNSTNGAGWVNRAGWLTTNTPCAWYGVSCESGHVAKLELNQNHLNGVLPGSLTGLPFLKTLWIYGNGRVLGGNLRGVVPPELGTLKNLRSITLAMNDLLGGIPPELGDLSELGYLNLNGNRLTGSIPATLGRLRKLWGLQLCCNQLSGNIPPELGSLNLTDQLALYANRLNGPIPAELGRLARLQFLSLSNNLLDGSIPPELGNMSNLRSLEVSQNRLTGPIPRQLGSLSNLENGLYLSDNPLGGSVPAELGHLTRLKTLDLSRTSLSGALPTTLTALPLTKFRFDQTWLCEPWQPAFQGWLAGIPDLRRTGVPCTTLGINYPTGGPGSCFLITGCGFPPNALATVSVNGVALGAVRADGNGCISLILVTNLASPGAYIVTITVSSSTAAAASGEATAVLEPGAGATAASVRFTIVAGQPARPRQGSGPAYEVPAGIAFTQTVFLPIMLR